MKTLSTITILFAVLALTGCASNHSQAGIPRDVVVTAPHGVTVHPSNTCIGAVVNGVCHGSILSTDPMPKTCHGEMLGGQCTGPMF